MVKICDFGLARDIYKDPDYVRKGDVSTRGSKMHHLRNIIFAFFFFYKTTDEIPKKCASENTILGVSESFSLFQHSKLSLMVTLLVTLEISLFF